MSSVPRPGFLYKTAFGLSGLMVLVGVAACLWQSPCVRADKMLSASKSYLAQGQDFPASPYLSLARDAALTAARLNAANPDVWVVLSDILAAQGKADAAAKAYSTARLMGADKPRAVYPAFLTLNVAALSAE